MAAYAALASLMNNMEQIQSHPRLSTSLYKDQIESLSEKIRFLLDFMEKYSHGGSEEAEELESQIASAAHAAEDVIESHVVDQILAGSTEKSTSFLLDLKEKIEEMDSIEKKVMEVKEKWGEPAYRMPATTTRPLTIGKTTMVGFDEYLVELMDMLTGDESSQQVISIAGMGGIGKTTLARNVYEHLCIVEHFYFRAWATISQEYSEREILLELLSFVRKSTSGTVEELKEQLYQSLYGRRYLIILDDVWSFEVWNKLRFCFPDIGNGSRIILTTRLSNMGIDRGFYCFRLNFLDDNKSWDLFCEEVFGKEKCPPELERIGKEITKKCGGLPLSIVVIGGLLGKFMVQEYWENMARDMSSMLNSGADNQCLNILSLSYNHLPAFLKPCFLYLGIFPEDSEIHVSQLIKLWVAEGFIRPNKDHSLEDVAEGYIKDLFDMNLIFARSLRSNGKFKTCYIHDQLRELCLTLAKKEKFLYVTRVLDTSQDIDTERRIINHGSTTEKHHYPGVFHPWKSTSLARSLICKSPALFLLKSRLLRVLIEVYSDSLDATFQQVNLRFLAYECIRSPISRIRTYELPPSISLLWNVQTLRIDKSIKKVVAPCEIWEMPQLRHLEFYRICLPDPHPSDERDDFGLGNLQTLGTVLNFMCSEGVYKRMRNIKKLRIFYDDFSGEGEKRSWYFLYNIGHFSKLESLYYCFHKVPNRDHLPLNLMFPNSLKKLILQDCELQWDDLTVIGKLPNLEVLKLKDQSVRGPEWNPIEGEFLRLKFLEINSCYLIYWKADSFHFPLLENLVLGGLYKLEEIPSGIGEISTLESISVVECTISAAISAIEIQKEQENAGNEDLHVRVRFRKKTEEEEFKAKVELEGLATHMVELEDGIHFWNGKSLTL